MKKNYIAALLMLLLSPCGAWARTTYQETIDAFEQAGASGSFDRSYGYALFPSASVAGRIPYEYSASS